MRDDFQDYSPDPSSQRSVTDWLMQVISGKKSIEAHGAPEKARAEGAPQQVEASKSAIAVEDMPHEAAPARTVVTVQDVPRGEEQKGTVQDEKPFTAEDLCGPAVFRPSVSTAPIPINEEITAEDLCWVPKEMRPQQNGSGPIVEPKEPLLNGIGTTWPSQNGVTTIGEVKEPPRNGAAGIVEAKEPHESQEHVITAADITREGLLDVGQFVSNSPPRFPRYAETVSAQEHEITAADITRESVLYQMESLVQAATAAHAETKPEASETVDRGPSGEVQQTLEVQPEVEGGSAESAVATEIGLPEQVASAPEGNAAAAGSEAIAIPVKEIAHEVETESVAATSTAEELSHENKPQDGSKEVEALAPAEDLSRETKAGVTESVFAHEGIWGNAAREQGTAPGDDAYPNATYPRQEEQEPDYAEAKQRYLSPEDIREIEEMKPEGVASAWKALLKLGSVMPWLARSGAAPEGGSSPNSGLAQEAPHEVAHLRMVQYEIRSTVHDHSLQLKRMEEQLTRVREVMESESSEHAELTESVMSTVKLVRLIGMGLGALLVTLIVMVGLLLVHGGR
jgi:hypothetical protein